MYRLNKYRILKWIESLCVICFNNNSRANITIVRYVMICLTLIALFTPNRWLIYYIKSETLWSRKHSKA